MVRISRIIILPIATAIILFLVSPPNSIPLLHFVAFLPLFFSLSPDGVWRNLLPGYIAGFATNVLVFYWIPETISNYSNLPLPFGIASLILLSAYISIPYAILSLITPPLLRRWGAWGTCIVPAIYTTVEHYFPQIFPYQQGVSLFFIPPLAQLFSIGGTGLATFLIIHVNILLFFMVKDIRRRGRVPLLPLLATTLTVAVIMIWGTIRISGIERRMDGAEKVRIGIVQPGIEIEDRRLRSRIDIWQHLVALTVKVIEDGATFAVWPEGASPYSPRSSGKGFLEGLSKSRALEILTGGGRSEKVKGEFREYNSAFLVTPEKGVAGHYDKIKLLAFGEYLPFSDLFPVLKDWIKGGGDFERGKSYKVFESRRFPFSVLICYEAIIPGLVRRFVREGARVLVNITNDAWFGRTPAPYQHLMLASVRCIELGVPMIRCANTGVSAVILPNGRTPFMTPIYREDTRTFDLPLYRVETFYFRTPYLFPLFFTLVTTWTIIRILKKRI